MEQKKELINRKLKTAIQSNEMKMEVDDNDNDDDDEEDEIEDLEIPDFVDWRAKKIKK